MKGYRRIKLETPIIVVFVVITNTFVNNNLMSSLEIPKNSLPLSPYKKRGRYEFFNIFSNAFDVSSVDLFLIGYA